MKVIDLLNRIANGEETFFDTKLNDKSVVVKYYNDRDFSNSIDSEILTIVDIIKSLNDEVATIEDKPFNKRVEEIYNRNIDYIYDKEDKKIEKLYELNNESNESKRLSEKINEIIDKINSMEVK